MSKFYIYKMTVDDGGAPCVEDGLLSLAICKPRIRTSAKRCNVVFGFAASSLSPDNRLIYVAEITEEPMAGTTYYSDAYSQRADCIYEWKHSRFDRRLGAKFHGEPSDLEHDLGPASKGHRKAKVLLSKDFKYFGFNRGFQHKGEGFPYLTTLIESLGQGHRVNHSEEVRKELERLKERVWQLPSQESTPVPSEPCPRNCRDDNEGSVEC
jgi:hypothetical protein